MVLPLLLTLMGDAHLPMQEVLKALTTMLELMAEHTRREHASLLWDCLLWQSCGRCEESSQLKWMLHLVGTLVSWRNGDRITKGDQVIGMLQEIIADTSLPDDVMGVATHVAASLLLVRSSALSEARPLLMGMVESLFKRTDKGCVVVEFCKELALKYAHFTEDILPRCVDYCNALCQKDDQVSSVLLLLARLCMLYNPAPSGNHGDENKEEAFGLKLDDLNREATHGDGCQTSCLEAALLKALAWSGEEEQICNCWASLVCVQYARPISAAMLQSVAELYISLGTMVTNLGSTPNTDIRDKLLFVRAQAIVVLITGLGKRELLASIPWSSVVDMLRMYPTSLPLLASMYVYLEKVSLMEDNTVLTCEELACLLPWMQLNLSSPSSKVRLYTLKILCQFPQLPLLACEDVSSEENAGPGGPVRVLSNALEAEHYSADLSSYRDRLLALQRLKYFSGSFQRLPDVYREVALRYLIGNLYLNLKLMWQPVLDIICSYATESTIDFFWSVFGDYLSTSSDQATARPVLHPVTQEAPEDASSITALLSSSLSRSRADEIGQPDHANVRQLLWQCLGNVPEVAEPRSRIMVPLAIRFVQEEYFRGEDQMVMTQNLRSNENGDSGGTGDEEAVVGDESVMDSEVVAMAVDDASGSKAIDEGVASCHGNEKKQTYAAAGKGKRELTKTLLVILETFSKFKNPRAFYRQEELWQLYVKLLTHSDPEVQKLALACLMTSKPPYLVPYRDSLEKLLEDNTFREELMNFCPESECSLVSPDHWEQLLPLLLRVLYGRLQRHGGGGGHNAGGKVGVAIRRGAVLRFLGSCGSHEVGEFMKLILTPFQSLLDLPPGKRYEVDPGVVVPLRKQQGFLHLLSHLLTTLGLKLEPFLDTLLPLLLHILSSSVQLLDYRQLIQVFYINSVKQLRQLAMNRLIETFSLFPGYNYTPYRDYLFSAAVWPQLSRLPQECVQHPTQLMKLLATWCQHASLFHLLAEGTPQSPPPLHHIYSCLSSPGVSEEVCGCVMEMSLSLLNNGRRKMEEEEWEEEEEESLFAPLEQDVVTPGEQLVLPFIPSILHYLDASIQHQGGVGASPKLLNLQFVVLSRISRFVSDPQQSVLLIELLLSFLLHPGKKYKQHESDILQTIQHLIPAVEELTSFFRPLSQLFLSVLERSSRNILCNIFVKIAQKIPDWLPFADILSKTNSWDKDRLDEPDYTARLAGYSEARQLLRAGQGEVVHLVPILYNTIFFLLNSDDMSIRDAAAGYLSELMTCVKQDNQEAFQTLILNILVNGVKLGVRSKLETARLEFIGVLSELVKTYPTHPKFSDMASSLSSRDAEADFFENVRHIQLHRRTRSLRKLAEACSAGSLSLPSILTFLLPLAAQVIFGVQSNAEQNLVAEAIGVVGASARQMRWPQYSFLLRHYMRQLPKKHLNHKVFIKTVVAILDAFHFDLSLATPPGHATDSVGAGEKMEVEKGVEPEKGVLPEKGMLLEKGVEPEKGLESAEQEPEGTSVVTSDMIPMGTEKEDEQSEEEEEEVEEREGKEVARPNPEEQKRLTAQHIHDSIVRTILPRLQAVLTKQSELPGHKLSKMQHVEEAEMLRVPVAMAMTKLLMSLPESTLHTHLPNLLMKVCHSLKNRSRDVRDVARETLVKMATILGPRYLQYVIKEMKELLTRGYQLHVLAFSLHSLLKGVSPVLKAGDLDSCMQLISMIVKEDLFGLPAEEREIGELVAKIPESKTPQSLNTYEITAQYLSPHLLPDLLSVPKQVLEEKQSARVARVVEEVFRRVGQGVMRNDLFTAPALLVFVHGLVRESIPQLTSNTGVTTTLAQSSAPPQRSNIYLIPPAPARGGHKPVSRGSVAAHIVTEFALHLFQMNLKHNKFDSSSEQHLGMLDPFVSLLSQTLSSQDVKVTSRAALCLIWVVRMPLPSLVTHIGSIATSLFNILRRYARAGAAAVGNNRELVVAAFKAMTVVVRDFPQYEVEEEELRHLLTFVEEDIMDYRRHSTAFPLLKAILGRKLIVKELYDVMQKVAELSITSDSDGVRSQCRQAVMQFLLDYPLGKKLQTYLELYIKNLGYAEQSGRESVLEFLVIVFKKFPEKVLNRDASFFFVPLVSQLVNDESSTCRQMIAEAIKTLLQKVDTVRRSEMVSLIQLWFGHDKLLHKRLAAQSLGLLVEMEGKAFEKRLSTFLPSLLTCLDLYHGEEEEGGVLVEEGEGSGSTHQLDHLLFYSLLTLEKVATHCTLIKCPAHTEVMNKLWEKVHGLLLHPHTWVRLSASRLIGALFASYRMEEVVEAMCGRVGGVRSRKERGVVTEYILQESRTKMGDLCHVFCVHLNASELQAELASQALKNLVFLARVLHRSQPKGLLCPEDVGHGDGAVGVHEGTSDEENGEEEEVTSTAAIVAKGAKPRDLLWLIQKMCRIARLEAGNHPKEPLKRLCVLKWIAAVSQDLGSEDIAPYLVHLLRPVHRELTDANKTAGEELHLLAQEVVEMMKEVCGKETFSKAYAVVHQGVAATRERRRKAQAHQAVVDPVMSILRKRKKNQLKVVSKKRKILVQRRQARRWQRV
eukprot:Em0001g1007a